jgi:hypothetical protein
VQGWTDCNCALLNISRICAAQYPRKSQEHSKLRANGRQKKSERSKQIVSVRKRGDRSLAYRHVGAPHQSFSADKGTDNALRKFRRDRIARIFLHAEIAHRETIQDVG